MQVKNKSFSSFFISFINEFVTIRYVFTRDVIPDEYVALFICNRDTISKNPISEITTPSYLAKLEKLYSSDDNLAKYIFLNLQF